MDAPQSARSTSFFTMSAFANRSRFNEMYRAVPFSRIPNISSERLAMLDFGGKIIMPQSALEQLSRLHVMYPMMFSVASSSATSPKSTHCGVLEFCAPEGIVYLPLWMLKMLGMVGGASSAILNITNVSLPLGKYVRLQPQSTAFLDITDPRAVLEHALRQFTTMTLGDCFAILYNETVYEFAVKEVRSNAGSSDDGKCRAVSVVETDLQVEFEAPVGYVEKQAQKKSETAEREPSEPQPPKSIVFTGNARKLSDNAVMTNEVQPIQKPKPAPPMQPEEKKPLALNLPSSGLSFSFGKQSTSDPNSTPASQKQIFSGSAKTLRDK